MEDAVKELTEKLVNFRDEREWKQFHTTKNLAVSLSIEAAELLECFQWKNNEEVEELLQSEDRIKVKEEIADVGSYLLLLCKETGIDLVEAINEKIEKNAKKYPVELSRGNAKKYNEL